MYRRLSAIACSQAVPGRSMPLGQHASATAGIRCRPSLLAHFHRSSSTPSATDASSAPIRTNRSAAQRNGSANSSPRPTDRRLAESPNPRSHDDYWHSISEQQQQQQQQQRQRPRSLSQSPSLSHRPPERVQGSNPEQPRHSQEPPMTPASPRTGASSDRERSLVTDAQRRAMSGVYTAMASKHATNVLSNVRELLPLANNDVGLNLRLVASIASCPYVNIDQRAQWDLVISETIDSACSAARSGAWPVHILLVTHLARAVARRQLRSHVSQIESLLAAFRANPHPEQATDPTSVSKLHMSMLTMYNNAGQASQAIAYFEQSVPVAAWSEQVLAVAAVAMAAQHDQSRIRAMLTRAAEAKVIEYPFANGSLNRAFLEAFATLESAVVALEAISATVLARTTSETAVAGAEKKQRSGGTGKGGKMRGKDKYGKGSQARNQTSTPTTPAPPAATEFSPINAHVIVSLLQRCSSQVKPLLAPRILAVADAHGVPRSADLVGWLISLKRDTYDLQGAMHLYEEYLRTSPDPVSVRLMCPVLDVLRQVGKYEDVSKAHARVLALHARGVVHMNTMYSMCVVRAVADTAGVPEAERVFEEMAAMGVPRHPMVVGYLQRRKEGRPAFSPSTSSTAHADASRRGSITASAPRQSESESTLQSGEHYYLSALHDLVQQDRITDALKLWREMIEIKHITPTTGPVALFLNYYVTRGDVDGMEKLLAFTAQLNVRATPKWTRALVALRIKAYGFANRHAEGFRIWEEALAAGIVPDSSTQSLILDACGFTRSQARLAAIMDLLIREQWGGTNVNVWTSAVEAFCRMGDLESALNVVHKILPLKGLEPNVKMVGTLITVEPRLNRPLRDKRVWELVDRVGGQAAFPAGVRFDEPRPV